MGDPGDPRRPAQDGPPVDDLELVILESPRESWGIRGLAGDELELGYRVDV